MSMMQHDTEDVNLSRNNLSTSNKRVLDNSDLSIKNDHETENDGDGTVSREVKRHQTVLPTLDSSSVIGSSATNNVISSPVRYDHDSMQDTGNRTIILRNVSEDANASDIMFLLSPFSSSPPVVTFLSQDEVLVEMEDPVSADRAVRYLSVHQISVKGSVVTSALSGDSSLIVGHGDADGSSKYKSDPTSFRVLLVTITEIRYPVDIELLHRLFCVYGKVEKIVTFVKSNSRHQALIQFASAREARDASNNLNNKFIFDGCNKIQIQSSKLSQLVVKQNNEKSWDFTSTPFASKNVGDGHQPFIVLIPDKTAARASMTGLLGGMPANDYSNFPATGPLLQSASPAASYAQGSPSHHQMLSSNHQSHSMPIPSPSSLGPFGSGPQQYGTSPISTRALQASSGSSPPSHHQTLPPQLIEKLPRDLQNYTVLHQLNPLQTTVVICYNLPAAEITVLKLFNLLSLYGVVLRIKILREKPDTALAQYSHPLYATLACYYLANASFFGTDSGLQIGISKKTEVKLPPPNGLTKESADEAKRTMAFQAQDQRAQPEEVEKFIRAACKPTNTLFIANIHEAVTEKTLREMLSTVGTVVKFHMVPPKHQSKRITAMAEMANEKEALTAVCHLHNHQISGCNLKIAFSKQILNGR